MGGAEGAEEPSVGTQVFTGWQTANRFIMQIGWAVEKMDVLTIRATILPPPQHSFPNLLLVWGGEQSCLFPSNFYFSFLLSFVFLTLLPFSGRGGQLASDGEY